MHIGQCISTLSPHEASIHSLVWTSSLAGNSASATTLNNNNHSKHQQLPHPYHDSNDSTFNNIIISGDEMGVLIAHDIRIGSGHHIWTHTLATGGIFRLSMLPTTSASIPSSSASNINNTTHAINNNNSTILAAGGTNGHVTLFDIYKQSVILSSQLHNDDCRALKLIHKYRYWNKRRRNNNDNDLLLLTTSFDCSSNIWNVANAAAGGADASSPLSSSPSNTDGTLTTGHGSGHVNQHHKRLTNDNANDLNFVNMCQLSSLNNNNSGNVQHTDKILSCCYNTNNEDIITTGADGKLILWKPPDHV